LLLRFAKKKAGTKEAAKEQENNPLTRDLISKRSKREDKKGIKKKLQRN
jgi:hypothetical protein